MALLHKKFIFVFAGLAETIFLYENLFLWATSRFDVIYYLIVPVVDTVQQKVESTINLFDFDIVT